MSSAQVNFKVKGHVLIKDKNTGEVLLDKDNAIHNQNMAVAIARGLSNTDFDSIGTHQIYALALGNGGSDVDAMGNITYQAPNVVGAAARLYNQTYYEVVDEQQSGVPTDNSVTYQQSDDDTTSVVIITATIAAGEPDGQDTSDLDTDPNAQFAFDELGLFTYGTPAEDFTNTTVPANSLMLSHIIFSPILKTANRELVITYTLTISVS